MTQYIQTEFCLDLRRGNTESLPTWMKSVGDRPPTLPLKPLSIQLPLFDTASYVSKASTKTKATRGDRHKQVAIPTPQ
jgi:hypothetical protein